MSQTMLRLCSITTSRTPASASGSTITAFGHEAAGLHLQAPCRRLGVASSPQNRYVGLCVAEHFDEPLLVHRTANHLAIHSTYCILTPWALHLPSQFSISRLRPRASTRASTRKRTRLSSRPFPVSPFRPMDRC